MKWDIGFTEAKDFSQELKADAISDGVSPNEFDFIPAEVTISDDKKVLSYYCDLGSSTKKKYCSIIAFDISHFFINFDLIHFS